MPEARHIIAPFRGIRYETESSRDLSARISPPYDVISPALHDALLARDEHNFVRVELPQAADPEADDRYTRAADLLRAWLKEGVLRRDQEPAFYVVESEFTVGEQRQTRRGLFAAIRLPGEGENYVVPHEDTFKAAKADRFRLMTATGCMISPVMTMLEDRGGELLGLLHDFDGPPEAEACDHEGVTHRLWVVQEEATVAALEGAVGAGPLYIADGHHRFETAKAYRDEMRGLHPEAPDTASYNYALSLIVSAQDPALKILPTHRVVSGLGSQAVRGVEARLAEHFDVEVRPAPEWSRVEEMLSAGPHGRPTYAVISADGRFRVISARAEALPATASLVDRLDVTILRDLLLGPMTECDPSGSGDPAGAGPSIYYVVDPAEAASRVAAGEGQFAFFLRGTKVDQIIEVARAGERMPKKSTYFFPKAAAGVVISAADAETL